LQGVDAGDGRSGERYRRNLESERAHWALGSDFGWLLLPNSAPRPAFGKESPGGEAPGLEME
jgi:hypothetical protein